MKRYFLVLFILCLPLLCRAQEAIRFRLQSAVPVTVDGKELPEPWSGGLSTPQFSSIDLNKDGQPDLFVFDRTSGKVYTWLAVQQDGQWKYSYAPEYEVFFPDDLSAWVLLRDFNCDGLADIFTSTTLGIKVYRQEAAPPEELKFSVAEEFLAYKGSSGHHINMQLNSSDVPAITDMDGDGDLDILLAEFSDGYYLEHYRNMQAEEGQACGTLTFVRESSWWGGITECEGCTSFKFGESCHSGHPHLTESRKHVMKPLHTGHSGSSILLLDHDGDGDKDLLMGSLQCDNLVFMQNRGDKHTALMTGFEPVFPLNTKPANFNVFPAAYYEDVTFDGIPDLLVAPNATQELHNINLEQSVWLYKNKGTAEKPVFEFVQDDFLQNLMLDESEGAYPAFADLDADGDLDMLVGNNVAYRNGKYTSSVSHYENTGTPAAPAFTLITKDYLNLSTKGWLNIRPSFADLSGDGVPDLVLLHWQKEGKSGNNYVAYFPNQASMAAPFHLNPDNLKQTGIAHSDGAGIAFFDADGDGDLDYVLGRRAGGLQLYLNSGSAANPVHALAKSNFGELDATYLQTNMYPAITDLDGNGQPDLLIADDSGKLKVYRNISSDLKGKFTPEAQLLENSLTGNTHTTRFGKGLSIAAAEPGGAGKLLLIIGSINGGLYMLQQTSGNGGSIGGEGLTLKVYPNPLHTSEKNILEVQATEPVSITAYDITGRKVYSNQQQYSRSHRLPVQHLGKGMYLIQGSTREGKIVTAKALLF